VSGPPRAPADAPNLLLVLGMHRSGTSAAARATAALGFDLGPDLLPPAPANPAGFWEDRLFVAFNEALLAAHGARYDTLGFRFSPEAAAEHRAAAQEWIAARRLGTRPYAVKDPRLTRLLPFWLPLFAERPEIRPAALLVYRHPESVALSLAAREGMPRLRALLLWQEHLLAALRHTEGMRRYLIDYDRLVDDPDGTLTAAAAGLGLPPPDPEALRGFRSSFLETAYRHSRFTEPPRDAPPGVRRLVRLLAEAAGRDPSLGTPASRAALAALFEAEARLEPLAAPLLGEIARLETELEALRTWIAGLEAHPGYRAARALWRLWRRARQTLFRSPPPSLPPGPPPAAGREAEEAGAEAGEKEPPSALAA
jgi:hypothetical protein